jgi:pyruvate-formate lyase-activating enzyme
VASLGEEAIVKLFCRNPWEKLDTTITWVSYDSVGLALCSMCWATDEAYLTPEPVPLRDLPDWDFREYWNAPRFQEIRRQIIDGIEVENGKPVRCPPMCAGCPRLLAGSDPPQTYESALADPRLGQIIRDRVIETAGPRIVALGYDPSCNLACPSCRKQGVRWRPGHAGYNYLKAFQERTIKPILRCAEWVFFSGYGDPFGSDLYLDLLHTLTPAECPDLQLVFLTNGLGFTEAAYREIPLAERIRVVQFSVDAVTPETYRTLRGGSLRRVLENLAFVCDLRQRGKIERVEVGFVYQATNWRELPAFLSKMRRMGVDKVMVYTLLNHAHGEGYRDHAVHLPSHPDHAAAMRVLDEAREAEGIEVYVELPKTSSRAVE